METLRWLVGWLPPLTMSGMTKTTVLPLWASSVRVGMPMGWRMLSSVAAYRLSQSCGRQGGSATVWPGIKTSVVSGRVAFIRPWPYSNCRFITLRLLIQIGVDDGEVFVGIEADLAGKTCQSDKTAVDLRDGGEHRGVVGLQAAAVDDVDAAGVRLDEAGDLFNVGAVGGRLAGPMLQIGS